MKESTLVKSLTNANSVASVLEMHHNCKLIKESIRVKSLMNAVSVASVLAIQEV